MPEIGWDLGFELGSSVCMLLGATFGIPLEGSITMLFVLALVNYFGICEGYLVVFSLVTMGELAIGTGEGSMVGLSLGIPLVSPL